MDCAQKFKEALDAVRREGRYRIFADVKRRRGAYPSADHFAPAANARPITVWCSNDYLGMGQHPVVIDAMHQAIDAVGAGSGGTRNISGTTHYHVEVGDPMHCKTVTDALLDHYAIYLQPINYPTVPRGTERIRLTPSPVHTDEQVDRLVTALTELWQARPLSNRETVRLAAK